MNELEQRVVKRNELNKAMDQERQVHLGLLQGRNAKNCIDIVQLEGLCKDRYMKESGGQNYLYPLSFLERARK
jgi:hypothetical protein